MKKKIEQPIAMKTAGGLIHGNLILPEDAKAVIIFAHGSGSSRLSPRNQFVAKILNRQGLGTLLIDLLSDEEEKEDEVSGSLRFDIAFLAERLKKITEWVLRQSPARGYKIGYFGASTGAGAALAAAAECPEVEAVVSRGGRPDLAYDALSHIQVPVLLIVGEKDSDVLELNQRALKAIGSRDKKLEIVDGATHLFEEPGALEKVAELAAQWFTSRFSSYSAV